jgi:putative peptidoglycan lipid II flippase
LVFTDDWIAKWFGSFLAPASITWLTYAKNLMRVPFGVVGQGVGVASFPFLAQLYSEGRFDELNRLFNSTMKGLMALLIPISALTIAQSQPLVHLVFSSTRLRGTELDATAATLVFFSLGMFAWGAQNILARAFYATHDTWTPAIVGTAVTFASLPVYWLLAQRAQHLGLAFASSLGMTVYTLLLFHLLNRRTRNADAGAVGLFFLKITAASIAAGFACYRLRLILEAHIPGQSFPGVLLLLAFVTGTGIILLLLLGKLLGIRELDEQVLRLWRLASGRPRA